MPSPFSKFNCQQIVKTITNGIFALIDQDSEFETQCLDVVCQYSEAESMLIIRDSKKLEQLIKFAVALKDNTPVAELMELFEKINNPGFSAIHHFVTRLLDENSKLKAHALSISVNPCPSTVQTINDQNLPFNKKINDILSRIKLKTLSPAQKINYALLLAKLGRQGEVNSIIAEAYKQDESLKNAHARIGWQLYWPKKEYDKVIEWMKRDASPTVQQPDGPTAQPLSRLSPAWRLNLAQAYAANGDIDIAQKQIEAAYACDSELTGDPECVNNACTLIFHMLKEEEFDKATKLAGRIGIAKELEADLPPKLKIRLIFIDHILLGGTNHAEQLVSMIKNFDKPIVFSALSQYSSFLIRRAECPPLCTIETRAIRWISDCLVLEASRPGKMTSLMMTNLVIRFLVLSEQIDEAFKITCHCANVVNQGISFTKLSLFLWSIGKLESAKKALAHMESFVQTESKEDIAYRAIALGIIENPERAFPYLQALYIADKRYFADHPQATLWSMLAFLLKAMGQKELSRKALRLGRRRDPLHKMREHLIDRISEPESPIQFPKFEMPPEFND